MNSRERLTAASRGGPVDHPPWFAWSPSASLQAVRSFAQRWAPDAVVAANADDARALLAELGEDGPAVLAETSNPFALASEAGADLDAAFGRSPAEGEERLIPFVHTVGERIERAMEAGVDGVLYCLRGANPAESTPMSYSGFYLEHDRDLLEQAAAARFNVLFVEGGVGVYLDFVHDLPASALAWDEEASGVTPRDLRKLHSGALACGLSGDHAALWEESDGIGLIFAGRVPDLASFDFSPVKDASMKLGSAVAHE
ncbi:MAG: hypothetical protein IH851_01775 [Armatimonadetes bacterium]|nr:hypothetical protein [Armatimonadota bacterium]